MLAETMAGVRSGKTDPAIGRTVAYLATALLRAYEADPPAPAERPSIYTALQFRTNRSAGITESSQQKERQSPGPVLAPALPAQTGSAEVVPNQRQAEEYEILDIP
jgi:hypothetical protein